MGICWCRTCLCLCPFCFLFLFCSILCHIYCAAFMLINSLIDYLTENTRLHNATVVRAHASLNVKASTIACQKQILIHLKIRAQQNSTFERESTRSHCGNTGLDDNILFYVFQRPTAMYNSTAFAALVQVAFQKTTWIKQTTQNNISLYAALNVICETSST